MYAINSDKLTFTVDGKGMLTSLSNNAVGHDYAGKGGLWNLIYSCGSELEKKVAAENCVPEIEVDGATMRLSYSQLQGESGERLDIGLKLTAKAVGDEVRFAVEIDNNAPGIVVRELHFPLVRHCRITKGQRLIWSHFAGERFNDVLAAVHSCHTQYMAKDNMEVRMSTIYPGYAATNAFVLENDSEGLYFGSHDLTFQYTLHLLAADNEGLIPGMVKYPFIAAGQSWQAGGYVLSPYQGSWHMGAKKYRTWANIWFKPQAPLKMVENMNGWQRIIMRHQYGEIHYRYNQLEKICHDGAEAGIDTLFMFGWNRDGHDAGYPEYVADESQGGLSVLRENVHKFKSAGGKLILYFNGQLIDMGTEFYRRLGKRISVKKADGNEHMEVYPFGGNGTALRQFGNKTFVTACPACEEWFETLKKCVDSAIDIGADGIFFDQLGWLSQPCHDCSHGHPVPFMTTVKAKADMLEKLNAYVKSVKPDMPLGIEWLTDLTAFHVDFVHNMEGNPASKYMDWFYYMFPEVRTTDRGIRDDTDVERRVNRAILKGLRSDVEIYRCRRTIAETPHYSAYLKEANRLRDKYRHIILNGRFCDKDYFALDNQEIDASCFRSGDELAVILTQSSKEEISVKLAVPGTSFIDMDGLNDYNTVKGDDGQYKVHLGRHGLCVIRCRTN
jgi:hypothetical protein